VPKKWADNIGEVLYTREDIDAQVSKIAKQVSADYANLDKPLIVVGLLKGCYLFMADLTRKLEIPYILDFIVVSSYAGTNTTGTITMKKDLNMDVEGAHILIVEDLIDTGTTLAWIQEHLKGKKPASVKIACLLNKEERRKVDIKVDYVGDVIPDKFVVGYGMDFNEEYRGVPVIGVLKPSAYKKS
jgi:hypoxanthine phosphoribosyltransferase